jgi:hypothetical protein
VVGGAGGSGRGPRRSTPWVNLGGAAGQTSSSLVGRIDDVGRDIARIELRFAKGIAPHDDAGHGVELFITDETVAVPGTVVLLDEPVTRSGGTDPSEVPESHAHPRTRAGPPRSPA